MIVKDVLFMTRWFYILFLCWGVGFFCGCSRNENPDMASGSGDTQVSFVLSLSNAGIPTRATWGDNYTSEEGNGYENRIDPDDVQVMLFNASGAHVATVEILSYYPLNDGSADYRFIGSVTAEEGTLTAGQSYKLMVFANCETITDTSNLGALSFNYNAQNVINESQLIPMWGVITKTLTLEKGKQEDLGTIDLLRAMAKIEINLASAISGTHTITGATLSKYNSQGYCLPKDYAAVENTKELEQETGTNGSNEEISTFHPLSSASTEALPLVISTDKKTAWLYIPEYDNSPTDAATISITLSDGSNTTTGTLEFKDYTNGTATGDAHDIVRNHIYRYTVNVEAGKLTVQYKALPWNLVETSIGWMPQPADYAPKTSEDYPFNGGDKWTEFLAGNNYILLPTRTFEGYPSMQNLFHFLYKNPDEGDDEAKFCFICRPGYVENVKDHSLLKNGSGGARYFFLLTGPKGATWEAHLTNTEDFAFSTTKEDNVFTDNKEYGNDGSIYKATHGIARQKPYVIQIIAKNDYTKDMKFGDESLTDWGEKKWFGQQVVDTEFYITVRLTDGTEYELTINPSYSQITAGDLKSDDKFMYKDRRRYAGTDTRIWIRQLRAQSGWSYNELVENNDATHTGTGKDDFAWWRVNPYWNSNWEPEKKDDDKNNE